MKTKFHFLLLSAVMLMATATFVSCGDDNDEVVPTPNVVPTGNYLTIGGVSAPLNYCNNMMPSIIYYDENNDCHVCGYEEGFKTKEDCDRLSKKYNLECYYETWFESYNFLDSEVTANLGTANLIIAWYGPYKDGSIPTGTYNVSVSGGVEDMAGNSVNLSAVSCEMTVEKSGNIYTITMLLSGEYTKGPDFDTEYPLSTTFVYKGEVREFTWDGMPE